MTILVFGHKAPDTDSTGSPLIWAWYLTEVKGTPARAVLLGEPNTEAAFVLDHWGLEKPEIVTDVADGAACVVVDTNNPGELPDNINNADVQAIIDHHKLAGGLVTKGPIDITMRPLACTATIMHDLIGPGDMARMPDALKGAMLSCILSDTMHYRSPTTTDHDKAVAEALAADLGIDVDDYVGRMFAAKSDVSRFSDADLLKMDSKKYEVGGKTFRVSVLETTSPETVLARKAGLIGAMGAVAADDGADEVLLFVVDILNEQATLLIPNDVVRGCAEKSFGVPVEGDSVLLPGIVSRKKQIVPVLAL
ncbi:manganese-dependent inorganic pyrophosphatase [Pontibaca methylaminivorans]|uniref:manganese-dependent inorganic pyrophosphatase n=1 Tax=Pontibaca methylaminivorans TaxID=515897 RepID=UPI002FD8D526